VQLTFRNFQDGTFICKASQKIIPSNLVNDDYCDCSDGSDEPGTGNILTVSLQRNNLLWVAACAKGMFHCVNKDFKGMDITASKVNDGVCDCCDGSDEYDNLAATVCPINCAALAALEAIRLEKLRKVNLKSTLTN
jgi:protein kinase C substrate 80K-H